MTCAVFIMRVSLMGRSCDSVQIIKNHLDIPLFIEHVSAGFPSPAQDFVEQALDLNELCIQHPAATYFVRVEGDSMLDAGIYPDDVLVVDRSLNAEHGDIIVASVYGELTVKELQLKPFPRLLPRNNAYPPIEIPAESDLVIFGVVTNVIRNLRTKAYRPA